RRLTVLNSRRRTWWPPPNLRKRPRMRSPRDRPPERVMAAPCRDRKQPLHLGIACPARLPETVSGVDPNGPCHKAIGRYDGVETVGSLCGGNREWNATPGSRKRLARWAE